LNRVKSEIVACVNTLWALKFDLSDAYARGLSENDFLPRRLIALIQRKRFQFEGLVEELRSILSTRLSSSFLPLSSPEDLNTARNIRTTIQYIKNAYTAEPSVADTLKLLKSTLPDPPTIFS